MVSKTENQAQNLGLDIFVWNLPRREFPESISYVQTHDWFWVWLCRESLEDPDYHCNDLGGGSGDPLLHHKLDEIFWDENWWVWMVLGN